mmetsp:Transcript_8398/g.25418  ORF Transcript_8398/g.25418 Transcript_8398/m.25418 type:complete len:219 (-) Transcript_8398:762-1418(-)
MDAQVDREGIAVESDGPILGRVRIQGRAGPPVVPGRGPHRRSDRLLGFDQHRSGIGGKVRARRRLQGRRRFLGTAGPRGVRGGGGRPGAAVFAAEEGGRVRGAEISRVFRGEAAVQSEGRGVRQFGRLYQGHESPRSRPHGGGIVRHLGQIHDVAPLLRSSRGRLVVVRTPPRPVRRRREGGRGSVAHGPRRSGCRDGRGRERIQRRLDGAGRAEGRS